MKGLFALFCFAFSSIFAVHTELQDAKNVKPATIKVLLKKAVDGALVEVKGPYKVYNIEKEKYLSSGLKGKRFYLFPHSDGIKWGEIYPSIFQVRVVPTSGNTTILVDGIEYRGCMEFYNVEGKIHIVNEVDVESYIKSTISSHFLHSCPTNIIDCVAIVARTNAYYTALANQENYWHVKADAVGYLGNASTLINPQIDRAVDATKHMIMIFNESPFPCTWTENCAGNTAKYSTMFRKKTKTPEGVESIFAKKDRGEHIWTYTIDKEQFAKLMKINRVTAVELFVDGESKKVYGIRIKDGNHQKDLDFFTLQSMLGSKNIKSTDFTVRLSGSSILFQGYGEGMGSGLCLYSADEMIKKGDMMPQILASFFPHTRIQKMAGYPEIIERILD